jgi:hypothetical protein
MKAQTLSLALICMALLPSCAALRTPRTAVTLENAVKESVEALNLAEEKVKEHGHSWGLKPAEVTLTFNISNEQKKEGSLEIQAPVKAISLGGAFSFAESTQRGNTIVMRFTRGGR